MSVAGISDGARIPCPSCSCVIEVSRSGQGRVFGQFADGDTLAGPAGSPPSGPGATPPPPQPSPSPGSAPAPADPGGPPAATRSPIPGYVVLEELGRGGMAVVFKARQQSLDRIVALKIMARRLAADPDFVKRFEREAKALAALNHPNITSVYDRGQASDKIYFVMEFVEGPTLRDVLQQNQGRLPEERALRLMAQVAEALSYVHGRGTIHRDIKPENVLIAEGDRVKVTDFGLAAMAERGPKGNLTGSGMMMGTLNYMPPEQRVDASSVDHRADIYSFGVMLYELLTGSIPIGKWTAASELDPSLDPRLDEVIATCLVSDRHQRYQSIDRAREALEEIRREPGASPELNIPLMGAHDESSLPSHPSPSTPPSGSTSGRPDPRPAAQAPRISDPGAGYKPAPAGAGGAADRDLEALVEAARKDMVTQRMRGLPTRIQDLPGLDPSPGFLRRFLKRFVLTCLVLVLVLGGLYAAFEPTALIGYLVHTPPLQELRELSVEPAREPLMRLRRRVAERLEVLAREDPEGFRRVLSSGDSRMVRLALRVLCTSEHTAAAKLVAQRLLAMEVEPFEGGAREVRETHTETARRALQLALNQAVLDRDDERARHLKQLIQAETRGATPEE